MRVEILKAFGVDSAAGRTSYAVGQIVPNGQRNWIDKGLAKEAEEPKAITKGTTDEN